MAKITKLTPEQEAELPAFRQKYLDIACGGSRINHEILQGHLNDAYALIGKPAPALFIFDSPAACMLAIKIFKMGEKGLTQLGSQLESQLESQLGSQLGSQLESQLWSQLRSQLRSQLESQLRSQLGSQNIYESTSLWGGQDLYWIAFYRFCQKIGVAYPDDAARTLDIVEGISSQCEWWWPYEGVVIASEKPRSIRWDDNRLLHGEAGPAVEYADGYALYAWHGQSIPGEWVTGAPPTPAEALTWRNLDQRAAACEIIGWHRILDEVGARTIDDSGDPVWGKLVEVDLPDNGPQRMLDAKCGTGRRFALLATMNVNTVDEAQSELHGGIPAHILRNSVERT